MEDTEQLNNKNSHNASTYMSLNRGNESSTH